MTALKEKVKTHVDSNRFQAAITVLIIFNALVLGIRTAPLEEHVDAFFLFLDYACIAVFSLEIAMRIYAYGREFFKDKWNVFDFIVVAASLIPVSVLPLPTNILRLLRVFRTLRILRIVSSFSRLRVIVRATIDAVPGILWAGVLMFTIMYVYALIGTISFGDDVPQYFGNMMRSLYTLFECMTLEGWNGVAEETMLVSHWAWLYFLTYIVCTALILMNVVVGIIVESVQHCQDEMESVDDDFFANTERINEGDTDEEIKRRLDNLSRQMDELNKLMSSRNESKQ